MKRTLKMDTINWITLLHDIGLIIYLGNVLKQQHQYRHYKGRLRFVRTIVKRYRCSLVDERLIRFFVKNSERFTILS